MADAPGFEENVIAVSFQDDSNAFEGLTRLKELDVQHQVEVEAASVINRAADGHLDEKDEIGGDDLTGTAGGGLIGLIIGILGGPLGVLVGGATGVLVGSLFDLQDADDTDSVLAELSKTAEVGRNVLLAQVTEQSTDVIDTAMSHLGGTVLRRPVYEVEAEISAAEKAQREAKRKARKELREARQQKQQKEIHEKVDELKAKLPGHKHAAAAGG
jgi:uncharacterized membrane protein